MKGQLKGVTTRTQYLAALAEPRRSQVRRADALIRKAVPGLKPVVLNGILGYGPMHYRYASGREGDACRIALASNKQYISLYVCVCDKGGYIAEQYKARLPGASVGKCCVRFKSLDDLDCGVLVEMLKRAATATFGV